MQLTYVILSALSLLNMGVQGATIAKALTSKHCNDVQEPRNVVHDRRFHNADFIACSGTADDKNGLEAQRSSLSTRGSDIAHQAETETLPLKATDANNNGVYVKPNPAFLDYITHNTTGASQPTDDNTDLKVAADDPTGSGSASASTNPTDTSDGNLSLMDALLGSASDAAPSGGVNGLPLLGGISLPGLSGQSLPGLSGISLPALDGSQVSTVEQLLPSEILSGLTGSSQLLPGDMNIPTALSTDVSEREDDESDQVDVSKTLDFVSSSFESHPTLDSSSVTPQSFERRSLEQKREDGVLETDLNGKPFLQQNLPTEFAKGVVTSRGLNVRFPLHNSRQHKSSHLRVRQNVADLNLDALEDQVAQQENIALTD